MTNAVYYNENDPFAAAWLRNLIAEGHIAKGEVDERSIADVRVADLEGFTQCHFFAGIGIWALALRQAGWPDDRPVWTGSCPCQPFSGAGARKGFADARHLWPEWFRLIRLGRPQSVLGEQVASALGWLDLVSGDLEGEGYAIGAAIVGAHSVGAPHIRQRIYWVADSQQRGGHNWRRLHRRCPEESERREASIGSESGEQAERGGTADGMANSSQQRRQQIGGSASCNEETDGGARRNGREQNSDYIAGGERETDSLADSPTARRAQAREHDGGPSSLSARSVECGGDDELADSNRNREERTRTGELVSEMRRETGSLVIATQQQVGLSGRAWESRSADDDGELELSESLRRQNGPSPREGPGRPASSSYWSDCYWIPCIDGKSRPVEPGTFPLAHGYPNRVGTLRGYGNALCAPQAQAFVETVIEVCK